MAWDDSEFTSPDYSQYDQSADNQDLGGYEQAGSYNNSMSGDNSAFWDNVPQQPSGWEYGPGNVESWANVGGTPVFGDGQMGGGFMQNGQFTDYSNVGMQSPIQQNFQGLGNSAQSVLGQLFSGGNAKGLTSVLGALAEGRQNKKYSNQAQNTVQQMRQQISPFDQPGGADPTSMRGQMQAQLTNAMQNPYAVPIVKAQSDAIARAQAIKDAAAGRRSNSATSSPTMLAAQAQVAQNYINSLQNPAGAGMSAGMGGLEQLLAAQKAGAQGYVSPLMSAIGYNTGTNTNSAQMAALVKALQGGQ